MSRLTLGKIALTPKGEWDSTTTYEKLDIIKSGNKTFITKQNVPIGTTTSNTEYYQQMTFEPTIDDNAGEGDTDKVWSADKLYKMFNQILEQLSNS